jgi:hypothetical protein
MAQTAAEAWMEEGVAKGELRAHRNILRQFLTEQFGVLPEGVQQQIDQATDLERLAAAIRQAFIIKSLDELKL